MSNKQTKLLKQMVELTGDIEELNRQEKSIKSHRKLAEKELQDELLKFNLTGEIVVKTAHYNGVVKVRTRHSTEIVETDISLVPAMFTRISLNKDAIRAKMKLDGEDSVPGVILEKTTEVVIDVSLL